MTNGVLYKLNKQTRDRIFAIFPLSDDVEMTVFGEDGRDFTYKAKAGDVMILEQTENGDWTPYVAERYEVEDTYEPLGS